jgi:hypothetical protein
MKPIAKWLFAGMLLCVPALAADQFVADPICTISPSGKFVLAIYRNQDAAPMNHSRIVIYSTADPIHQLTEGTDFPNFAGAAFSTDERCLLIFDEYDYAGSEGKQPAVYLLRRAGESRFGDAVSLDFNRLTSAVGEPGLAIRSAEWGSGSAAFVLEVAKSTDDSGQFWVWQVLGDANNLSQAGKVLTKIKYSEEDLLRVEQKQSSPDIEQQLNAIYPVLKRSLSKQAQTDLIADERGWLEKRDKLPPGFDQTYFTRKRINELTKRLLHL